MKYETIVKNYSNLKKETSLRIKILYAKQANLKTLEIPTSAYKTRKRLIDIELQSLYDLQDKFD